MIHDCACRRTIAQRRIHAEDERRPRAPASGEASQQLEVFTRLYCKDWSEDITYQSQRKLFHRHFFRS
jgi:hypothetical protein